ncbi:MAG: phospholipase D-like domain-containing protein [Bdellovibrionota bacterium]|nr:phospholipase D-like domain-containing protein [Bdellovibrionota bacterium]
MNFTEKLPYFKKLLKVTALTGLLISSSFSTETRRSSSPSRQNKAPVTTALFSPHQGEKAFRKIYKSIKEAKKFVYITIYSWSDKDLDKAIKKALLKENRPSIKVVISPHLWRAKREKLAPRIKELELLGAKFKVAIKDMHEKFTLVDDEKLVNTSANFSWGARTKYSENFIFHEKGNAHHHPMKLDRLFKQFKLEFEILWNTGKDIITHDEGISEEMPFTEINAVIGNQTETNQEVKPNVNFFSSSMNFTLRRNKEGSKRLLQGRFYSMYRIKDENKEQTWTVRNKLIELIQNAKKSIHLNLNHLAIASVSDALIEAIQRGVEVKFVVDNQEFRRKAKKSALMAKFVKDWSKLEGNKGKIPPVRVKYYSLSPSPKFWFLNHHKYILIDYHSLGFETKLFSGSYNISRKAEHNQFDNMVLYSGPEFSKLFTSFFKEFNHIWKLKRPLTRNGIPKKDLNEKDLLKLIKTEDGKLVIHFKESISLNWKEITELRQLFAKEISSVPNFWQDLRDNKHCQYFVLETSKFDGCKQK